MKLSANLPAKGELWQFNFDNLEVIHKCDDCGVQFTDRSPKTKRCIACNKVHKRELSRKSRRKLRCNHG